MMNIPEWPDDLREVTGWESVLTDEDKQHIREIVKTAFQRAFYKKFGYPTLQPPPTKKEMDTLNAKIWEGIWRMVMKGE